MFALAVLGLGLMACGWYCGFGFAVNRLLVLGLIAVFGVLCVVMRFFLC